MVRNLLALLFTVVCMSTVTTTDILLYDLRSSMALGLDDIYEYVHLLGALNGLANRGAPRLFTIYSYSDLRWQSYMNSINWPHDANYIEVDSIVDLIKYLSDIVKGVALYDPKVPATSNLATTASGVYNLIPICYRPVPNSLYTQLVAEGLKLPINISFVNMFTGNITGSAKADAFIWAAGHFLDSKLADGTYLGYYIDQWWSQAPQSPSALSENTGLNQDWIIKNRGFIFDLSPWDDETPDDDPKQPLGADFNALLTILRKAYQQHNGTKFSTMSGFVPWLFKYNNGKHGDYFSEWRMVQVMSTFNVLVDADSCCVDSFGNAVFYSHYALTEVGKRFVQNPLPSREQLIENGFLNEQNKVSQRLYILYYAGDYDSAAWFANLFKNLWDDPKRGSVPIEWAVNPNLYERFPLLHSYLYRTRTPNDFFVSGNSGAGYINPTQLFEPRPFSGLLRADDLWIERNRYYFNRFNLKHTGFVINGLAGYTSLGETALIPGTRVPTFTQMDLSRPHEVEQILSEYQSNITRFLVFRGTLRSATNYANITEHVEQIQPNISFVDPYTFALLARIYLSGDPSINDDLVSYVDDTLPTLIHQGDQVTVNFSIRNEGWNILNNLQLKLTFACHQEYIFNWTSTMNHADVTTNTYQFEVTCNQPGEYQVTYQLFRDTTPSEAFGNVPWISSVQLI